MDHGKLMPREVTGQRLLSASARHSFDPDGEVDWEAPLLDGMPFMPLHRVSLYGTSMFASVLVAEEVTDRLQREMMHDESLQPLTRTISRIHVIEEGRHVRYAREELTRLMPTLLRPELELHRCVTSVAAYLIIDNLIQSRVYRAVGIEPRLGRKMALRNPHHRQTRRWMGEKVTRFLDEMGMIGSTRPIWRKAHLTA